MNICFSAPITTRNGYLGTDLRDLGKGPIGDGLNVAGIETLATNLWSSVKHKIPPGQRFILTELEIGVAVVEEAGWYNRMMDAAMAFNKDLAAAMEVELNGKPPTWRRWITPTLVSLGIPADCPTFQVTLTGSLVDLDGDEGDDD